MPWKGFSRHDVIVWTSIFRVLTGVTPVEVSGIGLKVIPTTDGSRLSYDLVPVRRTQSFAISSKTRLDGLCVDWSQKLYLGNYLFHLARSLQVVGQRQCIPPPKGVETLVRHRADPTNHHTSFRLTMPGSNLSKPYQQLKYTQSFPNTLLTWLDVAEEKPMKKDGKRGVSRQLQDFRDYFSHCKHAKILLGISMCWFPL